MRYTIISFDDHLVEPRHTFEGRLSFWFCTLDDASTIDTRHRIGVERIMLEVDYPHGDTTWPDTQQVIEQSWGHVPPDELRAMCCGNAAALYFHPLPETVLPIDR